MVIYYCCFLRCWVLVYGRENERQPTNSRLVGLGPSNHHIGSLYVLGTGDALRTAKPHSALVLVIRRHSSRSCAIFFINFFFLIHYWPRQRGAAELVVRRRSRCFSQTMTLLNPTFRSLHGAPAANAIELALSLLYSPSRRETSAHVADRLHSSLTHSLLCVFSLLVLIFFFTNFELLLLVFFPAGLLVYGFWVFIFWSCFNEFFLFSLMFSKAI